MKEIGWRYHLQRKMSWRFVETIRYSISLKTMMTKLILFFLTILSGCSPADSKQKVIAKKYNQDSIEYMQKSVDFIKQVKEQELLNPNFILADKPFDFKYFDCLQEILIDTATFSKEELAFIEQKKYPSTSNWSKLQFTNIKFVSSDTVDLIFQDGSKGWTYFYKNIGRSLYSFSVPIFLRNYSYCLFYSDNSCGWLCGGGRLALYKKENNKWIEIKSYCNWIS